MRKGGGRIAKNLKYQIISCIIILSLQPTISYSISALNPINLISNPTGDAYILKNAPDESTGNLQFMNVRNTLGEGGDENSAYDSLIKFSIPTVPTNAKNLRVSLNIYFHAWNSTNSSGRTLNLYKILTDWGESTVTWNQQPSYGTEVSSQATVPSSFGWMTWNVTNDVFTYLQGGPVFYGWKVTDPTDWGMPDIPVTIFRTKEYGGTTEPYLEITYDLPSITVQSPNGGETWYKGETHTIQWSSAYIGNTVDIILINNGDPNDSHVIVADLQNQGSYQWSVPTDLASSQKYKIKILDSNDESIFDESNQFFAVNDPYISVNSPDGGEYWYRGEEYDIQWSSGNAGNEVTIKLLNNTVTSLTIGEHIQNSGRYTWKVPSTQKNGVKYKIQITSTSKPSLTDTSNNFFTITQKPVVGLTSPDGGEKWYKSNTHKITWTAENLGDYVKIDLYKSTKLLFSIDKKARNNGNYYWSIPQNQTNGTDYKIKISSLLDTNIYDTSSGYFSISLKPEFTINSPSSGTVWYKGDHHFINWTSQFADNWVKIVLQRNNYQEVLVGNTSNNGQYRWTVPTSLQSAYYTIVIIPLQDTSLEYPSSQFSIEDTPSISATTPQPSEPWYRGEEYSIHWTSINAGDYVRILLYKNDTQYYTISQYTKNDGEFLWKIPDDFAPGSYYRIKIESTSKENVYTFCQGNFVIRETWFQQWWWACGLVIVGCVAAAPVTNIALKRRKKNMVYINEKKVQILQLLDSLQPKGE